MARFSDAAAAFRDEVRPYYDQLAGRQQPNEAETEQDLIRPVLGALGWTECLPQQRAKRGDDIPDYLLFSDAATRASATAHKGADDRYQYATVVEESKRLDLPLDAPDADGGRRARTPHGQILRYLATADTENGPRWGFLTNGRLWRIYDYRARPRATAYYEADLGDILQSGDDQRLRTFFLLFRRDSFVPRDGATSTFLVDALAEGRHYEERVAADLSKVVFDTVFPDLVTAIAREGGDNLPDVRQAALIFLYRLLFLLYAEDRNLLPVHDSRYATTASASASGTTSASASRLVTRSPASPRTTTTT